MSFEDNRNGSNDTSEKEDEKRKKDNAKITHSIGLVSRLCVSMPLCILVGFFIGKFLDRAFSTGSTFLIVFLIFGIIASYTTLFKSIKK